LTIRKWLKEKSILGLYGSDSIRNEMVCRGEKIIPTSRTMTNILKRHGKYRIIVDGILETIRVTEIRTI
jgi:hypothetical protein